MNVRSEKPHKTEGMRVNTLSLIIMMRMTLMIRTFLYLRQGRKSGIGKQRTDTAGKFKASG